MNDTEDLSTLDKALKVNLDPRRYGTFLCMGRDFSDAVSHKGIILASGLNRIANRFAYSFMMRRLS